MIISDNILSYITNGIEEEFDPFYIYDKQKIIDTCRVFQSISYNNKSIHFASMANTNPLFLKIVKEEDVKIFVNSILHLEIAEELGFKAADIIFTASALSRKTMRRIQESDVQLNLDSPKQLLQWLELFPERSVGIRCNIGDFNNPYSNHAGAFIGKESRLGFTREEIGSIEDKSIIKGLHLYIGTDITDINYFTSCYKELIDIARDFPEIEYLNFGGGFGISEKGETGFDFAEYNTQVTGLMNDASSKIGINLRLILEPGRIIGCEAGYFVCQVSDIKVREHEILAGVNASTVQFSRPLLYPDTAKHPVAVIRDGSQLISNTRFSTTIYGCSTYSKDIFARHLRLPELRIGDMLVFGNSGSYSASSHSQFLGFARTNELFV